MGELEGTFNRKATKVIRYAGLIIPVILLLYGLLIRQHLVLDDRYINDPIFLSIILGWIVLAVVHACSDTKNLIALHLRLLAYHFFSILYILFVAGFATPFIVSWIILLISSYIYFQERGLRISFALLITTGFVDAFAFPNSIERTITTIIYTLSLFVVGMVVMSLNRSQEIDKAELERARAQESLQRDRVLTIINNLTDAILSTDKNGIIRMYNAAGLNLLDTNTSPNGESVNTVLPLKTTDGDTVLVTDLLKKAKSVTMRDDLILKNGEEDIRLEVTYSPVRSIYKQTKRRPRGGDEYILILRDITKAKSLEEEKDEFISVVSHELRTPITVTEGTISNVLLMMNRKDIPAKRLQDGIATAHDQVLFLAKMVNDLSTLSRAERGVADTPEQIIIKDIIHELYNEYAPQAEKKGLRFNLDIDPQARTIFASRLYLKELLQNFIINAVKYTKEGSVILRVKAEKEAFQFSVQDTGIGISKNEQKKVFEKFYRSEDYRTRETGGTGLGLYVVIKLAKKLNASIGLTSRLNHGSTFTATIPVKNKTNK